MTKLEIVCSQGPRKKKIPLKQLSNSEITIEEFAIYKKVCE
jgi:hypothetical protein